MNKTAIKIALTTATLSTVALLSPRGAGAQPHSKPKVQTHSFNMVMQSRGRLGAQVISMSADLRRYFGASKDAGLLVDTVLADSPAAKAGLKTGDVIVAVDGKKIAEAFDIRGVLSPLKKGDKVKIEVVRNKKKKSLVATLDDERVNMGHLGPRHFRGNFPGDFDFDFNPGNMFDKDWGKRFGKEFGRDIPHPFQMQEKIRRLEERLNRLEGTPNKPTKPAPKKSSPPKGAKKFKTSPSAYGPTS